MRLILCFLISKSVHNTIDLVLILNKLDLVLVHMAEDLEDLIFLDFLVFLQNPGVT